MTDPEVEDYLQRLTAHIQKQLLALEHAVVREFKCRPYWDPLEQAYRFTNSEGRKHKHYTKN